MRIIEINENGICMQFIVDDENRLSLYHVSTGPAEIPSNFRDTAEIFSVVEVQTTGAWNPGNKHILHKCPSVPRYVCHEDTRNEMGRQLVFTLKTGELEIKQVYQFYDGIGTVSCFAVVTNISGAPVGVEYISSFCYAGFGAKDGAQPLDDLELYVPHNSWCEELNWRKQSLREAGFNAKKSSASTKCIRYSNQGYWSTKEYLPMGILNDRSSGVHYFWQVENNGAWQWELGDLEQRIYLRLAGPSERENSWWKRLEANESFQTVPAALSVSNEDFGGVIGEMTKYRRKIIDKNRLDPALSVVFNDYMDCLGANPTTENELPIIERAAKLGAEIYCMDAGWYSTGDWWSRVGEWNICEERFNGGIKQIFDKIKQYGMKAGIWLEPEVMGVDCPLAPEFEDCFLKHRGKNIICRGRYQLDFRKEKVRRHLDKTIDHLIDYLGVSYFKFDYNIDPMYGTETDSDSDGDGQLQCNQAFLAWVDSLYERHPQLMIENCASGGLRMDYGTLRHFTLQSVSDSAHYNEFAHMSAMVSTAVIPEQAGIWVVSSPKNTYTENAFAAVNGMLHRMYLSGRIDQIGDEDFSSLKDAVECYKSIRADLIDSLPLFPEGVCNAESDWMMGGCVTADQKRVYITAAHLKGAMSEKSICLKEIPGGRCTAEVLYPHRVGEVCLNGNVINVKLPEKSAVLLRVSINSSEM